jgi:hypothetical protein
MDGANRGLGLDLAVKQGSFYAQAIGNFLSL